jgi:hypothetical protein
MSRKKKEESYDEEEGKQESTNEISYPQYRNDLHWTDEENKAPIRAARDLFFKEFSYERIFLATGIPPSIFRKYAKRWSKVKERVDQKIVEKIRKKAVSEQSKEFIEKGLQVGLRFIDRLLKREDEITPKDWKLVSDSIMALHRVHQLEIGKPTDISVYEKMSPQEIQSYLLTVQKQLAEKHEMSMFAADNDVPEEELLAEYNRGKDSGIH